MRANTHGRDLDALNATIVKSREDIAALAAGLKKLSEWQADKDHLELEETPHGPSNGNGHATGWSAVRRGFAEAEAKGESAVRGFANQMERHPLLGGMAAFGVGFVLATLMFKRSHGNAA